MNKQLSNRANTGQAIIAMALLIAVFSGCLGKMPDRIKIGPVMVVSQGDHYVAEPHIAVDPTDPNHLAVSSYVLSEYDCREKCHVSTGLYTSRDGGKTWSRQLPNEVIRCANLLPKAF